MTFLDRKFQNCTFFENRDAIPRFSTATAAGRNQPSEGIFTKSWTENNTEPTRRLLTVHCASWRPLPAEPIERPYHSHGAQHTPVLRQLLKIALITVYKPASTERLANELKTYWQRNSDNSTVELPLRLLLSAVPEENRRAMAKHSSSSNSSVVIDSTQYDYPIYIPDHGLY